MQIELKQSGNARQSADSVALHIFSSSDSWEPDSYSPKTTCGRVRAHASIW